ncbi:MAG: peroxiredoxin [Bdellovibrionales bacterium]|nr:peroxiredoxin [Bdellovibrionales bacterium]
MAKAGVVVGKKVPKFKLPSTEGDFFRLDKMKGRYTLLYFYPKDNTPGCTQESIDFKKLHKKFHSLGVSIYGISRDSLQSHAKFIDKQGLPFPLLSDEEELACQLFDVIKMKNLYGRKFRGIERSTFFIDQKGILQEEWRNVRVPNHVRDVFSHVEKYIKSLAK